jgi:NTP pyrophosphatase (non-canonical NTP hydrolase)
MGAKFSALKEKVLNWADAKLILAWDNRHKQTLKMVSEAGEVCDAILKGDEEELKLEIGDLLVTVVILCGQLGLEPEDCLKEAYKKIAGRKGKTVNGVFIKE